MNGRYTLKKNNEFRRLYAKGKSAVDPYMVIYCRRNRLGQSRVGYTVSTKLGHAVTRNRVRRRLREIFRLNSHSLHPGYDMVIVARGRCVGAEYSAMEHAFLSVCAKLGLMEDKLS